MSKMTMIGKTALVQLGQVRVKFDPPLAVKESFRQELKLRDGKVVSLKVTPKAREADVINMLAE